MNININKITIEQIGEFHELMENPQRVTNWEEHNERIKTLAIKIASGMEWHLMEKGILKRREDAYYLDPVLGEETV